MADLRVKIAGVELKNPIITASGTFGFGREYDEVYDISLLGGISCKGTTLKKKDGNPPIRIAETPSGMLNSVGLQNPGVEHFIKYDLPFLKQKDITVISNIAGSSVEDYCKMAEILSDTDIDMIEMNISCPNVKEGGVAFGTSCESAGNITKQVRKYCKKPLIVKLSPNVTSISEIAKCVEAEGADAVSMINTITGMRIDINSRRPILRNNTGGLSGPAVLPVAVRMVNEVYRSIKLPIIGMGGIAKWEDAVELLLAGSSALQIGTAIFNDPYAPLKVIEGLNKYMDDNKIEKVSDITGKVQLW
ncbi:MAG: dihydroorotate dehydrogenase [Clostridia bacterium]|nr:dihydroorotate dehydrogenase [Clostridia bacterium]